MGKGRIGGKGKRPEGNRSKGKGKGGAGSQDKGKGKGSRVDAQSSKGKGKDGKGKGKDFKGMTRKERKSLISSRRQGAGGTGAGSFTKSGGSQGSALQTGKVKKKMKKENSAGSDLGAAPPGEKKKRLSQAARKRRLKRATESGANLVETPTAASLNAPSEDAIRCKGGHTMARISENPKRYTNQACCDACFKENLPKRTPFFYHCALCRFDICDSCAKEKFINDFLRDKKKQKKLSMETETETSQKRQVEQKVDFNKSRRDILAALPTEDSSVAREPLVAPLVSSWIEGQPV